MVEKQAIDTDDGAPPHPQGGVAAEGAPTVPAVPDYPMTIKVAGSSRLRLLLLLLALVVAGGGYSVLLMTESSAPPPPPKVVAVVPPPAPQPEGAVTAAPAPAPAAVAVAPPPTAAPPQPPPAIPAPTAAQAPPARPVEGKAAAPAVGGDAWRVAVGTYQDPRAARAVAAQIRGLGYQPQVDSVEKNVAMTRLRLGVFPASAVKEALASAREIAPDAFALRSGDSFTIYAGTFTRPRNLRQVSARLASAGVPVEEEPVMVQRALSRVQLGGFADQAAAAEAAARMRQAGIAAEVVAPR